MRELKVDAINNGTVIDHIPAGKALKVLELLQKSADEIVTVGMNFSGKTGKKDILKYEERELNQQEVNKIAIVAPNATINIIRNYEVVNKFKVELPEVFENLTDCPNPICVTQSEKVRTTFVVESKEPVKLRCHYCERTFNSDEINF